MTGFRPTPMMTTPDSRRIPERALDHRAEAVQRRHLGTDPAIYRRTNMENRQTLLDTMEALGPAGQKHLLLEAGGVISARLGLVLIECAGAEGCGTTEVEALADWRRQARRLALPVAA